MKQRAASEGYCRQIYIHESLFQTRQSPGIIPRQALSSYLHYLYQKLQCMFMNFKILLLF